MATKIQKRLYKVQTGECSYFTNVEANSVEEACQRAKQYLKLERPILGCTSEPIYEAGIGVETDKQDVSENGIFEIVIRGTDPALVDKMKKALGYLIPGPHINPEDGWDESLVGSSYPLKDVTDDLFVTSL